MLPVQAVRTLPNKWKLPNKDGQWRCVRALPRELHQCRAQGFLSAMPVPSDELTWLPIAHSLFSKRDLQQLSLKKAVRLLCRKGAKKFGVQQSNGDLQNAIDAFIRAARLSGSLVLNAGCVRMPGAKQTDREISGQDADPAERKGRPATKILLSSAALADLPKQHAVPKKKGRPPAALGDSRASGGPHSKSLAPVPLNGPVRETPRSSEKHLRIASATEPQGKHGEQQPADEAPQAKRRKLSKKAREPAPGSLTGGRADGSHAESMPGIPASGAAEMTWKQLDKRMDVKRGRFSESEKETLLQAIKDYARAHNLSDTNLSWIYNTRNNLGNDLTAEDRVQRKSAWSVIAQTLPHRTPKSVWAFATRVLHEGNYLGKWSAEDTAKLLQLHAERGNKWKEIGAALGRHPENCRHKHRDLLLGEAEQKGKWSREEEAKLLDLVTSYIEERPEPDINSGRILIDAVNWDVVSQLHGTRAPKACRQKWYDNLAPSMVTRGDWGIGDDRRLLKALYRAGHAREWQVDWGAAVPERSAVAAKRRWRLMLKSVPAYQEKEFPDIVEELVSAHLPALMDKAARGQAAGTSAADGQAASG